MESRAGEATRLLYCTTGVLLRRLQDDGLLSSVSHVVVDEVSRLQPRSRGCWTLRVTEMLLVTSATFPLCSQCHALSESLSFL